MSEKNHKCKVHKELIQESEKILENLGKKGYCSIEATTVLSISLLEVQKRAVINRVTDDISIALEKMDNTTEDEEVEVTTEVSPFGTDMFKSRNFGA